MPSQSVQSSNSPEPREPAARGPYLSAVREAWRRARDSHDPHSDALAFALSVFARDGRARGQSVASLLRTLDSLVRPARGGDAALDFDNVREWAGTQVIRAYYQAD
jgi:hypothetical protein